MKVLVRRVRFPRNFEWPYSDTRAKSYGQNTTTAQSWNESDDKHGNFQQFFGGIFFAHLQLENTKEKKENPKKEKKEIVWLFLTEKKKGKSQREKKEIVWLFLAKNKKEKTKRRKKKVVGFLALRKKRKDPPI